jgi:hypothetical protein
VDFRDPVSRSMPEPHLGRPSGIVGIAYVLLWLGKFWERSMSAWRMALSVSFLLLAGILSWTGARALGRQRRIDAGLSSDHELLISGPIA